MTKGKCGYATRYKEPQFQTYQLLLETGSIWSYIYNTLWLHNIPLFLDHICYIYSLIDGHPSGFHILASMNKANQPHEEDSKQSLPEKEFKRGMLLKEVS